MECIEYPLAKLLDMECIEYPLAKWHLVVVCWFAFMFHCTVCALGLVCLHPQGRQGSSRQRRPNDTMIMI